MTQWWLLACLACTTVGAVLGLLLARAQPGSTGARVAPGEPSAADVLEALPVAVLVVDVSDEVLLGNRAARELGLVNDGVLAALPRLRQLVRDTRVHDRAHDEELEPLSRPGGPPAAFRARLARVSDGTVAVLLEDVTDARRLEDVRRDFVANVSHELKTPAAALGLLSEALQQAADDPGAVRDFAARTQKESARLAALVRDLVSLSRIEGAERMPDPQEVLVDDVIHEAVDRVSTTTRSRHISITSEGESGLRVLGSEKQLATALGNLLDNAVNYSADGADVHVSARRDGEAVVIEVSDEGIGINPVDAERVFERFYRADPARARATGGTGLGLAIVKHVASNHGGSVTVRSTEGQGSTFTLRIPEART